MGGQGSGIDRKEAICVASVAELGLFEGRRFMTMAMKTIIMMTLALGTLYAE